MTQRMMTFVCCRGKETLPPLRTDSSVTRLALSLSTRTTLNIAELCSRIPSCVEGVLKDSSNRSDFGRFGRSMPMLLMHVDTTSRPIQALSRGRC